MNAKVFVTPFVLLMMFNSVFAQSGKGFKENAITVAGGHGKGSDAKALDLHYNILFNYCGVCVDDNGNVYVADNKNARIQKWAPNAKEGVTIGGELPLGIPAGICLDGLGNLFIADSENNCFYKYNLTTGDFKKYGNRDELRVPQGIYVDKAGNIFVADALNNRIQKWLPGTDKAVTVAGGNGEGNAPSQFYVPEGVFVDGDGNLYVADAGNNRIQKWASGAGQGITVAGGNGKGENTNQLWLPQGVVVDSLGNMVITNSGVRTINFWPRNGAKASFVSYKFKSDKGSGNVDITTGVTLDRAGNLYVVDHGNNRVLKFEREQTQPNNVIIPKPKPNNPVVINNKPDDPIVPASNFTSLVWQSPVSDIDHLPGGVFNSTMASMAISARITSTAAIDVNNIKLLLNGTALQAGGKMRTIDLKTIKTPSAAGKKYEYIYSTTVTVPDGKSTLQVTYNDDATDVLSVNYTPQSLNLYVLSIGTSASGLKFPQKDALDFAALFGQGQQGNGKLFRQVQVETLTGVNATALAIGNKIADWSNKQFGPNDVLFIFISSHGYTQDGNLKITGSDYKTTTANLTSLDFKENILSPLEGASCKKFVFLDACHSGAGIKAAPADVSNAIQRMITAGNNTTVITSSSGDETSWEDDSWQNGAFTKAIKEALIEKKGDTNGNGIVSMDELFAYISMRVPQLVKLANKTDYGNHPVTQTPKIYNPKGDVSIFEY